MPQPAEERPAFSSQLVAKVLQDLLETDPATMYSLYNNRVPCNSALANHELMKTTVLPVRGKRQQSAPVHAVSVLGIIQALLLSVGEPPINAVFEDPKNPHEELRLIGFQATKTKRRKK